MSTSECPYSIPAAPQRIDAVLGYQESFFALIWPSVAFSILVLGLIFSGRISGTLQIDHFKLNVCNNGSLHLFCLVVRDAKADA